MEASILAELSALPNKTTVELKQLWRNLYDDREPPSHSRAFLIKGLPTGCKNCASADYRRGPRRS